MTEPQRRPLRYGLGIVAGTLAALAAWALVTALGVDLTVGKGTDASHVGVVDVLAAALVAGLGRGADRRLQPVDPTDLLSGRPSWSPGAAAPGPFAYSTGVPALPGSSRTVS